MAAKNARYKRSTRAQKSVSKIKSTSKKSHKSVSRAKTPKKQQKPQAPKKRRVPKISKGLKRPIPQGQRQLLAQPKRQLTTEELIKFTDPRVKLRAKTQNIAVIRLIKSKIIVRATRKNGVKYWVPHVELLLEMRGVTDIYQVHLHIPADIANKRKLLAKQPIRVYCSCPDFKYRRAYVLKLHKNLIQRKALGLALIEPPLIRNPMFRPGTCKHVLVALRWVRRKSLSWLLRRTRGVILSNRDVQGKTSP